MAGSTTVDHYEALQVSRNASADVIRVAYRQRLKECHPDTGRATEAEFEAVLAAGVVLQDPAKRQLYDQELAGISHALTEAESRRKRPGVATIGVALLALAAAVGALIFSFSTPDPVEVADEVQGVASFASGDASDGSEPDAVPTPPTVEPTEEPDAAAPEPAATVEPTATAEPTPTVSPTAQLVTVDDTDESEIGSEASSEPSDEELVPLSELPERGAIYRAPTLYLEGPVPTQQIADAFYERAVAVVGEENVVNNYVVRPDAPLSLDGNVRVERAVSFEVGSAVIRKEFEPILLLGFAVLAQNPQATMIVEGHTDSDGQADDNQELSEERAQAVADWLIGQGVEPSRITSVGYGESRPVADNATAEGREINRRIEVQLVDLLS